MALVALITRGWVSVMEAHNIVPRCLADDLMLIAEGSAHRTRAIVGMNLSRQFFTDMGARVATAKCFMFSTCPNTRADLKGYRWDHENVEIPVVNSSRDLGSHLNLTCHANGSTLTARLHKASRAVRRLAFLPISHTDTEHVIRSTILPAAIYGCEASDVSQVALRLFTEEALATCESTRAEEAVWGPDAAIQERT